MRRKSFLILSGGLGSSVYVRDEIQRELNSNPHPCASNIAIIQDPEPQLVVVKGLLFDRMQKLDSGTKPVLALRKARASYGVVCKHKYNPAVHIDEDVQKDPIDGELYAMGQIDWIIKKVSDMRDQAGNPGVAAVDSSTLTEAATGRHC